VSTYADIEAERTGRSEVQRAIEKKHNSYPDVYGMPSVFNPSGLVPYPCLHGIPVKPARYPQTKGGSAWFDADGNEKPPFGGHSWGRAKYLTTLRTGIRGGVASAVASCHVCEGLPVGDDFYTAADGESLR
jgi:hypothetical protein